MSTPVDSPLLLLTRPESDSQEWAEWLSELGIRSLISPVLEIEPLSPAYDSATYSGIIITSKHSLAEISSPKDRELFIVGQSTAALATEMGFTNIEVISLTADCLIAALSPRKFDKPLLYLSGDVISVDIPARLAERGITVHRKTAYAAHARTSLSREAEEALRAGLVGGVLLFSARSAVVFRALAGHLPLGGMDAFCFSEAIARQEEGHWRSVYAPQRPVKEDFELLIRRHYRM